MLWLLHLLIDLFLFYFILCKEKYYLCLCFEEWRLPSFTHFKAIDFCFFILFSAKQKLVFACDVKTHMGPFFYTYFLLYVVTAILHTIELPVIVSLHREIWPFSTAIAHCRNSIPSWNQFFLSLSQCHYIVHTL